MVGLPGDQLDKVSVHGQRRHEQDLKPRLDRSANQEVEDVVDILCR